MTDNHLPQRRSIDKDILQIAKQMDEFAKHNRLTKLQAAYLLTEMEQSKEYQEYMKKNHTASGINRFTIYLAQKYLDKKFSHKDKKTAKL